MNRASTQVLLNSAKLRAKQRHGQSKSQKSVKLISQTNTEAATVIQRWWKSLNKSCENKSEIVNEIILTPYEQIINCNNQSAQSCISELEINVCDNKSLLTSAKFLHEFLDEVNRSQDENLTVKDKENYLDVSFREIRPHRAEKLLQYLQETENNIPAKPESPQKISNFSIKLELEEACKTIESLKNHIKIQKFQLDSKDSEIASLYQTHVFDEMTDQNVSFIEQLLREKETRILQLNDLNQKIKEMEIVYNRSLQEIKSNFQAELQKELNLMSEVYKSRREKWLKEKQKEIKQNTAKILESETKHLIETLKEEYQDNIIGLKHELESNYEKRLKETRKEFKKKQIEMIAVERSDFEERLVEERAKIKQKHIEEIKFEKEKIIDIRNELEIEYQEKLNTNDQDWLRKFQDAEKNANILLEEQESLYRVKINQLKTIYENEKYQKDNENAIEKLTKELKSAENLYKLERDNSQKIALKIQALELDLIKATNTKEISENLSVLSRRVQEQELIILGLNSEKNQLEEQKNSLSLQLQKFSQPKHIEKSLKDTTEENSRLKDQLKILSEHYECKIHEITQKEASEFEAIESRIRKTINKKDEKIREYYEQLKLYQIKTETLELQLAKCL